MSWTRDEKDSAAADRVRKAFFSAYQRREPGKASTALVKYFRAESRGELLVYSDLYQGIEGWGHAARLARARGIAEELKSRTSDPVS